jgi:DNA invertase Pin-like site-specific DNA recombinase
VARLLAMVEEGQVKAVIVAKLDRLTRSVKDLCELLERLRAARRSFGVGS